MQMLYVPMLADDFYINPLDWSSQNILSLGLRSRSYIWSARTEEVSVLCDLSESGHSVTSVAWNEQGNLLAVGTDDGIVQIWDTAARKPIKMMEVQSGRVSALAWNGDVVTLGSFNGLIVEHDVRTPSLVVERRSAFHERE
ncbi:fizzy-related protein homolog, partial [Cryptotermes secundus]